jgi:hypothetical protein
MVASNGPVEVQLYIFLLLFGLCLCWEWSAVLGGRVAASSAGEGELVSASKRESV